WIWSNSQHFKVMVRLENQHMRSPKPLYDLIRHVADVRELRDLDTAGHDAECHRFGCIVWNGKWENLHVAEGKRRPRLNRDDFRPVQLIPFGLKRTNCSPGKKSFDGQVL